MMTRARHWLGEPLHRSLTSVLAGFLTSLAWAGDIHRAAAAAEVSPPAKAPSQTLMLQPATGLSLRIDFDFRFNKAPPPFAKEPALAGKEVVRGLIPTEPPTPFLRNISDNVLYLNTEHRPDFVEGKLAAYRSFYRGSTPPKARFPCRPARIKSPIACSNRSRTNPCPPPWSVAIPR
jgi:hypothetical protein